VRLAVADQPVEMHPDVSGFGRGIGERDGAVERHASLLIAAKLHQERAAHAKEMEITREPLAQRLDHLQRGLSSAYLGDRNGTVERHHRRRLHDLQRAVEQIDLRPIGVLRFGGACVQGRDRR